MNKVFEWFSSLRGDEDRVVVDPEPEPALQGNITMWHRDGTVTQYRVWFETADEAESIADHHLWIAVCEWYEKPVAGVPLVIEVAKKIKMINRDDIVRIELEDTSLEQA